MITDQDTFVSPLVPRLLTSCPRTLLFGILVPGNFRGREFDLCMVREHHFIAIVYQEQSPSSISRPRPRALSRVHDYREPTTVHTPTNVRTYVDFLSLVWGLDSRSFPRRWSACCGLSLSWTVGGHIQWPVELFLIQCGDFETELTNNYSRVWH